MHINTTPTFAYLCDVENKKKRAGACSSYIALITADDISYLFTHEELSRAQVRAFKNKEDIPRVNYSYDLGETQKN